MKINMLTKYINKANLNRFLICIYKKSENLIKHNFQLLKVILIKNIYYIKKLFLILITLSGLLYQTSELLNRYLNEETVVNTKFEISKDGDLPAITICFPTSISIYKYFNMFPKHQNLYKEYLKWVANTSSSYYVNKTYNKIILSKYFKPIEKLISDQNLTFNQITKKLSLNFFAGAKYIGEYIPISIDNYNNTVKQINEFYTFIGKTFSKCFSIIFYSTNVKDKMNIDTIIIHHDILSYSLNLNKPYIYVYLHPFNDLPDLSNDDNLVMLEIRSLYRLHFNQIQTELIYKKYKPSCKIYIVNGAYANSKVDCLNKCLFNNFQKKFKFNCFPKIFNILIKPYYLNRLTIV